MLIKPSGEPSHTWTMDNDSIGRISKTSKSIMSITKSIWNKKAGDDISPSDALDFGLYSLLTPKINPQAPMLDFDDYIQTSSGTGWQTILVTLYKIGAPKDAWLNAHRHISNFAQNHRFAPRPDEVWNEACLALLEFISGKNRNQLARELFAAKHNNIPSDCNTRLDQVAIATAYSKKSHFSDVEHAQTALVDALTAKTRYIPASANEYDRQKIEVNKTSIREGRASLELLMKSI